MGKEDLHDIKKMGRWVMIYKNFPQYIVSAQHARMLIRD
jgi:hypothetical protein